jgi:hypothetical protein
VPGDYRIIPNGIDIAAHTVRRAGRPRHEPVILFVGRPEPRKGFFVLLHASACSARLTFSARPRLRARASGSSSWRGWRPASRWSLPRSQATSTSCLVRAGASCHPATPPLSRMRSRLCWPTLSFGRGSAAPAAVPPAGSTGRWSPRKFSGLTRRRRALRAEAACRTRRTRSARRSPRSRVSCPGRRGRGGTCPSQGAPTTRRRPFRAGRRAAVPS